MTLFSKACSLPRAHPLPREILVKLRWQWCQGRRWLQGQEESGCACNSPTPPRLRPLPTGDGRGEFASRGPPETFPSAQGPSGCEARGSIHDPCSWPLTGFLKELDQEMSRHQERRQQAALLEHLLRVETKPALTALPLLPGVPMAGDSSPSVPPSQGKVTSPEPASSPQASSPTKKPCPLAFRSQQSTGKGATGAIASTTSKAFLPGAPRTTKAVTKRIKK